MSRRQNTPYERKQQAFERYSYLKNHVNSIENISVDDLLEFQNLTDKLDIIQILIKGILDHPEYLNILRTLAEKNYLPKITQRTEDTRYTLYNVAAYVKSCDPEIFKELISVISLFGYNIFDQNNRKENAFMAIMAENNTLSIEEKKFRYMAMSQISPTQIKRLVTSCFNKLNSDDKITMDKLRYALCVNPQEFIKSVAKLLIKKPYPDSCIIHDVNIYQYVKIIIETFDNCDQKKYNQVPVTEKSLELFFKLNKNRFADSNDLYKYLWNNMCIIATNNDQEKIIFNIQSLATTIGGFAKYGMMLNECRFFILECLKTKNSRFNIPYDERPKMAIRTLIHARRISSEIITALQQFESNDGFTIATISRLANPKDSIYNPKTKSDQNRTAILDVDSLVFFEGMTPQNIDDVIDDTFYLLDKILNEYPNNRTEIIGRFMFCFFKSITEFRNIKGIVTILIKNIDKNDIIKNRKYIEMNIIPSIKNQNCDNVWKEIIGCLGKK
ncbi:hypothetical protein Indivirus_1_192 [Indivirus ILV1]|uniref:Uncharacterized protein n=1 Tax=Indivirus ILV1 TaxID=1977633 RepID=A0A1V0SCX9_9VIRU|nr:hypothetical protein Indivirus_1_192 [Indivirus ILV1]